MKQEDSFAVAQFRAFKELAEGFVTDNLHRVQGSHYYCTLDGSHHASEALAVAHFKAEHADAVAAFAREVVKGKTKE